MSSLPIPVSHPANGLQDFIAISRYARYAPERRRRETWPEAVTRVRDMHLGHYGDRSLADATRAAVEAGELTNEAGRALGLTASLHEAVIAAFAAVAQRREDARRRGSRRSARAHGQ